MKQLEKQEGDNMDIKTTAEELSTFEAVPIELYYSSTNVEQLTLLARKESENNG